MATTLYPDPGSDDTIPFAFASGTYLPQPYANANSHPNSMRTTRGSLTADLNFNSTVASGTSVDMGDAISPPLAAGFTLSGTVTFNFWGLESNMSANCGFKATLYKMDCTTATLTQVAQASKGVELGTSAGVQNWTATPTSTAFNKGDRLVLRQQFANVGTMASGFQVTVRGGSPTASVDGDTFVTITETVTFDDTQSPTGTVLYPTDTASDIDPGADDERKLDFSRGASSADSAVTVSAGPISPTRVQRSGTDVVWYTPALNAATVSGPVRVDFWAVAAAGTSGGYSLVVEIIKRTSGGSETTIGKCAWAAAGAESWVTSHAYRVIVGISDTSLAAGDRLGFKAYIDDDTVSNILAETYTLTYNGPTGSASGDTFLTLNSTVSEQTSTRVPFVPEQMPSLLAQ